MHAAYRAFKGSGSADSSGLYGPSGARIAPPASWKKWRVDYSWDECAAAYDRALENETRARDSEARRRLSEQQLQWAEADLRRRQALLDRISELESRPLIITTEKIGDQKTIHDEVKEHAALTRELHALEDRFYKKTEPLRPGVADKQQCEDPVRRIVGTFTIGDQMWDGGAPPAPPPGWKKITPENNGGSEDVVDIDVPQAGGSGEPKQAIETPPSFGQGDEKEIDPGRAELERILKWRPEDGPFRRSP